MERRRRESNEGRGEWRAREAAAERAHGEWMPAADARWRRYQAGDLATIFLPETRITARDQPFGLGESSTRQARRCLDLKQFAESDYRGPARRLMGAEQEGAAVLTAWTVR
ncbi:alkaline phosphatase D family protein [Sphingopyxis sp.]|uniref:alkaline phosphatase D family protein n=1 Tax=Sphingopyxis sp. TaxID=1908224 RepID=UPI0025D80D2A|nr:alkaline phosphatase D family protein [Sphingopyxis sp.]MBK6413982.1 alkaline phosphatase D family protein [Sphingopyxis sp.]